LPAGHDNMNAIEYGGERISYQVVENPLLTSKVKIHVHPNGAIEVESPPNKNNSEIARAVYKRAAWISKQLANVRTECTHSLPREYVSGETHFYLGRRYQLKIIKSLNEPETVKMHRGLIQISTPDPSARNVRELMDGWYQAKATSYFAVRTELIVERLSWITTRPTIKLTKMKTQWGSCSPKGNISLNPRLIRAPRECIDYVITHELCHLREHNHSDKFYRLLSKHYPDWQHIKQRLDGMAELLLAE